MQRLNDSRILLALLLLALSPGMSPSGLAWCKDSDADLSVQQRRIRERYTELRDKLTHLADLIAPSNPRQAALLRQAVARGQEFGTDEQLGKVLELLERNQLSSGVKGQIEVERELGQLLDILQSEDRSKRLASEKARIREYLRRIGGLLREQQELRSQTEGEQKLAPLAEGQGKLAEHTDDLATQVEKTEGKPNTENATPKGEAKPSGPPKQNPPDKSPQENNDADDETSDEAASALEAEESTPNPTQQRLERAERAMRAAEQRLKKEDRGGAQKKQAESIAQLERAKASLEEIMKQLREEEHGQTLKVLLARFQDMLRTQTEVYETTRQLDGKPGEQKSDETRLEAARLAQREIGLVDDADRALLVLKEEPTAEAFAEGVAQLRDDLRQVAEWLGDHKTGELTQALEKDTLAALEDLVGSMRRAQKELAERKAERQPGQGQGGGGGGGDPPLVDKLQDLRMIRALQARINQRTLQMGRLVPGEETDQAEVQKALRELASRQERLEKITRDLSQGKKP